MFMALDGCHSSQRLDKGTRQDRDDVALNAGHGYHGSRSDFAEYMKGNTGEPDVSCI